MSIVRKRRDQADLSRVDWDKVDATTDQDIEQWADADPDTPTPSTEAELATARVVSNGTPGTNRQAETRTKQPASSTVTEIDPVA